MQIHHVGVQSREMEGVLDDAAERELKREHLAEGPVVGGRVEGPGRPVLEDRLRDHVALDVLEDVAQDDVGGLRASLLDLGQPLVISRDRRVVLDVQLRAVVLEDVEQRRAGRIVLDQSHLRRHRDDPRHGDVQEALAGLLALGQVAVEHAEKLKNSLFASRVDQTRIVDDEIRINLELNENFILIPLN